MNKADSNLLEDYEVIGLIVGFVVAIGFLSLPSGVAKEAKQNGWIAILIGGIYPIIESLICIYYCKNHPNENILALSKKYLGKWIGTICNFMFLIQSIFHLTTMSSGLMNIFFVFATPFLSPSKIMIAAFLIAAFTATRGIKVLGRINKITLYMKVIISLSIFFALFKGSYMNLLPVFQSDFKSILKGSLEASYSYLGIEMMFLFYPLIKNKDKSAKLILKANFIIILIYLWIVTISIYYLGYKVTAKSLWPVLLVTESVDLPVLNSTRFIFLFLWAMNMFTIVSNHYYVFINYFQDTIKSKRWIDLKKYPLVLVPIFIFFTLRIDGIIKRNELISHITPKIVLFNLIYISVIALFIFINNIKKRKV